MQGIFVLLLLLFAIPTVASEARVLEGNVVETGSAYGNLQTDIPASAITIPLGGKLTFACKEASFPATWVSWYGDVADGEWLALAGEGDRVQVAVSFGDADAASGCSRGDRVRLILPPPAD
jgi:S-adenosylmethionine hydrolase